MDYCLKIDGLVRFMDRIYVPDNSEFKKLILRKYYAKLYSSHPRYHKTLTTMNKFYYSPNLNKEEVEFLARCLDCQQVKAKCKNLGGLVYLILIP